MREIAAQSAAGLAMLVILSCAAPRSASVPGTTEADSLAAVEDSLASTTDELFIEKHVAVLELLAPREREGQIDPRVIEARSLVTAAEEMYLRGRAMLALRLLDDADIILRREP
jgi:hypothetical protein